MEQRDAQEEKGRSDRLWEVFGFPEYKRQGKSWEERAIPREMMAAEPLLLQGRNLSHLMICSKMLLETLSPQWD